MNLFKRKSNLPVSRPQRDVWEMMNDYFNTESAWDMPMSTRGLEAFRPAVDFKETDDEYLVEAELPGMKRDQIDISVKDNVLYIKGEKKTFNEENDKDYHHVERTYGSFYRSLPLPGDADLEQMSADFEDGLLTVSVAKLAGSSENASRKISIN